MNEDRPTYNTGGAGGASAEMPRFVSCKPIWALKIKAITRSTDNAGGLLHFEDTSYAPRPMSADWIEKRGAQPGGWLVVYPDGYLSWSPATAFENGTVPESMWGLSRMQEPKYTVNLRGQLAKRADQRQLPADEPLFVLRAQDTCAIEAIRAYRDALPAGSKVRDSCDERLLAFSAFRTNHGERMKAPSTDPTRAGERNAARWEPGERERMSGDDTAT